MTTVTRRGLLAALLPVAAGAAPVARPRPAEEIGGLSWHPDGKRLALGGFRQVTLLEAATGKTLQRFTGPPALVTCVAFSPDGNWLAAGGGKPGEAGEIRLWNLAFGAAKVLAGLHRDAVYGLAWSPEGRTLAAGSYDRLVSLWDVAAGTGRPLKDHTDAVYGVDYSPDGKLVASVSGDRTVKLWDPSTGRRVYTLSEATAELYAVRFLGSGGLVAGGSDRMLRRWNVTPRAGELARSAFAHDAAVLCLATDPTGSVLLSGSADGSLKQWDPVQLTERSVVSREKEWVQAISLRPDGAAVAAGRHQAQVAVHSLGS